MWRKAYQRFQRLKDKMFFVFIVCATSYFVAHISLFMIHK